MSTTRYYYCLFDDDGIISKSIADFQASSFGGASTLISEGYVKVSEEDHQKYITGQYSYDSSASEPTAVTTVYCYYNNGLSSKTVTSVYTAEDGEVLFDSEPTADELEAAFPTTTGSIVHTITTNAVADDTVTIQDIVLTAGTEFTVGDTIADTATNIAAALNANETFATTFKAVASDATITVSEIVEGGGNTPTAATYTGTIVISSATATTSVTGYSAALLAQAKTTALTTIQTNANAAYAAGFGSTAADGTTELYYDSDKEEVSDFMAACATALADADKFDTEFADGYPMHSRVSLDADESTKIVQHLTSSEIEQLGSDWRARVVEVKAQVWALKASVYACTDVDSVTALDLSIS